MNKEEAKKWGLIAKELIKAAASAENAKADFFKMGRFFSKGDK